MSQENVAVVEQIYDALARGDLGRVLEKTHPAMTCYDRPRHPAANVFHGNRGVVEMIEDDSETVDDLRWEPHEFTDLGREVLVEVRQSGRGKVSGVPVEGEVVMVWTVDGGTARELRIYSTRDEALTALGLSE